MMGKKNIFPLRTLVQMSFTYLWMQQQWLRVMNLTTAS